MKARQVGATGDLVSGSDGLGNYTPIWMGTDKSLNDSEMMKHLNKRKPFDNEMSVLSHRALLS